jgi:sulfate adenylyltransferase large subunit
MRSPPEHAVAPLVDPPATPAAVGLLRLITCGSVDDGKSTLIGRLLHDTKSVHRDQLEAVQRASQARQTQHVDLSLLTDGLRAEREQGITIDVAYRYFATERRRFILADTPGHVQYTRNMATGASMADAAVILVDARQGVVEQTRRHACIATLLGIRHLIVCINKMDLVDFAQARLDEARRAFEAFAAAARPDGAATIAERTDRAFIPISALLGDNVVHKSERTPWYGGPALLELLDAIPDAGDEPEHPEPTRFPVQYVLRPNDDRHHDYRGYAGRLVSGSLSVGDEVLILPGGQRSRIARIHVGPEDVQVCRSPRSAAISLEDDIDISRGDLIIRAADRGTSDGLTAPIVSATVTANVVWMGQQPLTPGRRVLIKHAAKHVRAITGTIDHRLNMGDSSLERGAPQLGLNEIGRARFRLQSEIAFDPYARCRSTGSFIIIDEQTNGTVGAGLLLGPDSK